MSDPPLLLSVRLYFRTRSFVSSNLLSTSGREARRPRRPRRTLVSLRALCFFPRGGNCPARLVPYSRSKSHTTAQTTGQRRTHDAAATGEIWHLNKLAPLLPPSVGPSSRDAVFVCPAQVRLEQRATTPPPSKAQTLHGGIEQHSFVPDRARTELACRLEGQLGAITIRPGDAARGEPGEEIAAPASSCRVGREDRRETGRRQEAEGGKETGSARDDRRAPRRVGQKHHRRRWPRPAVPCLCSGRASAVSRVCVRACVVRVSQCNFCLATRHTTALSTRGEAAVRLERRESRSAGQSSLALASPRRGGRDGTE